MEKKLLIQDEDLQSIQESLQLMDQIHEACFTSWIRDEKNSQVSARHIARIAVQYDPARAARGLRWVLSGWKIESVAYVFLQLFLNRRSGERAWWIEVVVRTVYDWAEGAKCHLVKGLCEAVRYRKNGRKDIISYIRMLVHQFTSK